MEAKVTVEDGGGLPTGPSTQGLMRTDGTHSRDRRYKGIVRDFPQYLGYVLGFKNPILPIRQIYKETIFHCNLTDNKRMNKKKEWFIG